MVDPLAHSPTRRFQPFASLLLVAIASAALAQQPPGKGESEGWHTEPGLRWRAVASADPARPGFTLLDPASTRLHFTNRLDELAGAANRTLYNGAGVAAGDIDGDGRPDLFFCDISGSNALFRNRGGFTFEDITQTSGIRAPIPGCRGAVLADVDGDRDLDLLLAVNGGGVLCFINDGRGRFTEATPGAGTASNLGASTIAIADVDGNGTPDLYVANYSTEDVRDRGRVNIQMIGGKPVLPGSRPDRFLLVDGKLVEAGQPDQLYLNEGAGRFRAVSWTDGSFLDENGNPLKAPPNDWGLTATFRDLNGDGAPDLYVCNDYWTPDRCWINDGKGRFRALPTMAMRKTPASSMGVDVADVDRDGDMDLFVVDMLSRYPHLRKRQGFAQAMLPVPMGVDPTRHQVMRNVLLLARGDGTYADAAFQAGVSASDWSWSPLFLDVDLDGYEDLLISAGHFRDVQDYDAEARIQSLQHTWKGQPNDQERQRAFTRELMEHYRIYPPLNLPVGAFRNGRDGRFEEVTQAWGLDHPAVHHGLASADLDGDGDADLIANTLNGAAKVFRNDGTNGRVSVRLVGRAPNTQAVGARVTLLHPALPPQSAEVTVGGRYLSGSDPTLSFAAPTDGGMQLRVRWRNGRETLFAGIRSQRHYEVDEAATDLPGPLPAPAATPPPQPLFLSAGLQPAHRHVETVHADEDVQPLLPHKLSQLGPGVAWVDFDGDGDDDLLVGSGRGGSIAAYLNDGKGGLTASAPSAAPMSADDMTGFAAWSTAGGAARVWIGQQGYEVPGAAGVVEWTFRDAAPRQSMASLPAFTNVTALAIGLPAEGAPLLFVGGGVAPAAYPNGAPSRLLRWTGDAWVPDPRGAVLDRLGIVNAAVWTDLDDDSFAELVLACEWGPVRVFRVGPTALEEITQSLGLDLWTGWWRGVHAADVDGDGRMDLVAANWGSNTPHQASATHPLVFAWGQMSQPGVTDVIQTEWVRGRLHPRLQLRQLAASMPQVPQFFTNHVEYSEAPLERVLGDRAPLSRRVEVRTLESMVFLNRANRMEARPLPAEAQRAPAFGIGAADFDGDGRVDLFLAQNFSQVPAEEVSFNAGLGLLLLGDGQGGFRPVAPADSGIRIEGDQRGAAVADYDGDGRTDLVVTQNAAETRILRNIGGKPGLRVRLVGPPSNPAAIGARIRPEIADGKGPAFEQHVGSGYWSQDSATWVVPRPAPGTALKVRFPGKAWLRIEVPAAAADVRIDAEGKLTVLR